MMEFGNSKVLVRITVALLLSLLLAGAAASLAQSDTPSPQHSLEFLDDETLTLEFKPDQSAITKTVAVRNNGDTLDRIEFRAILEEGDVEITSEDTTITGFDVEQFDLTFRIKDRSQTLKGYLIVGADGGVVPGERPLRVGPVKAIPSGVDILVMATLFAALGLVLVRWYCGMWGEFDLGEAMGPNNWDFKQSWASTLTTVGALLGTILSAGVLPDVTKRFSKAAFSGLNLLFGVLVVIAGLLYSATRVPKQITDEKTGKKSVQYQGFVWSFLLATGVTLWAVLGEIATMFLLVTEIRTEGSMSGPAIVVFTSVLVLAGLLLIVYAWRTIYVNVDAQTGSEARARAKDRLQVQMRILGISVADEDKAELEPPLSTWAML